MHELKKKQAGLHQKFMDTAGDLLNKIQKVSIKMRKKADDENYNKILNKIKS